MVYILLGSGFEEMEALAPLDLLRRAGIDVLTVGVNGKIVYGGHNIGFEADITLDEMDLTNLDMIVLPGGLGGVASVRASQAAMDALGIQKAHIFGVSMGGMIAQHLAADYPEAVDKLILTVTCARPNPVLEESVLEWIRCAKENNHTALMDSNLRRIYSDGYYRRNKWMIPIIGKLTKPQSYDRFFVQAEACLNHDAYDQLPSIQASTLVIGGSQDKALGGEASREIAEAIDGAVLKMYPLWGHGLYEEAPDFIRTILDFLCS